MQGPFVRYRRPALYASNAVIFSVIAPRSSWRDGEADAPPGGMAKPTPRTLEGGYGVRRAHNM